MTHLTLSTLLVSAALAIAVGLPTATTRLEAAHQRALATATRPPRRASGSSRSA